MVDNMANSSSPVAVNDECKLRFLELRAKKKHQFIVFKVEEKTQQVIVEKLGKADESYGDFTASLPANECRFAVYDFGFKTDEKCQNRKIFFIAWSPDSSTATNKMLYASSKEKLNREVDGIQVEFTKAEKSVASLREQEQENSKLKRELNEVKRELFESRKQASNFEELSNERAKAFEEEKQQSCKLSQTLQQKEAEEKGKIYQEGGVDFALIKKRKGRYTKKNDMRKMWWSEGYRQGYSAASGKPTKEVEVPPAPITTHDPTIPQDV